MKQIETRIVCDLCELTRLTAEIRCDTHGLDLCTAHMRAHFDPKKCRLVPVERKPTAQEEFTEKVPKTLKRIDAALEARERRKSGS